MILVVGATGVLGSKTCKELLEKGQQVRAMVRASTNQDSIDALKKLGAEIAVADLKDPASVKTACQGVEAVVSTATSVSRPSESNNFDSVDQQGQLNLVALAKESSVKHFVYISFPEFQGTFPLQSAKRAVEAALRTSGMDYTILQAPHFQESWLVAPTGINPETNAMLTFGGGKGKISWIAIDDVCKAISASLNAPKARNRTLQIGGTEALSQNDIIVRCETLAGRPLKREDMPQEQLDTMFSSGDPMMMTFSGLMSVCVEEGCEVDNSEAEKILGFRPRPIKDHLAQLVASLPAS
ncbi:SDR family oxidoreductase [Pseudovibrio brasiliensis]|uniref:SDR family oxidoreductase n=1 Tax=Pseudovibrio brasiliensis TaxID=1898042 RepID=A0ABX8AJ01_9HYPH|nr:SDR family oxidoreductase [Pseudovibrio brasiliensis]QUS55057.1 SDR family oxidoreductase [Pseudovibrio brasiliensis]